MLSLNQIKNKLVGFLENHAQLQLVTWSDDFDFAADRNLSYPVANVEYINSSTSRKQLSHSFKVTLADLANENAEGIEDEIYSDMLLIADDFTSWLEDQEGFEFNSDIRYNKFVDSYGDRVAGIAFSINLSVIRRQADCMTPKQL